MVKLSQHLARHLAFRSFDNNIRRQQTQYLKTGLFSLFSDVLGSDPNFSNTSVDGSFAATTISSLSAASDITASDGSYGSNVSHLAARLSQEIHVKIRLHLFLRAGIYKLFLRLK